MAVVRADDGPAVGYDPDRYYEQVVRGLRGRPHDLPTDLRRRYAIPDRLTEAALRAHLEQVLKDWEARVEPTREGEVYRVLLAAHAALDDDPDVGLWSPQWWASYHRPRDRAAVVSSVSPLPSATSTDEPRRVEPGPAERTGSPEPALPDPADHAPRDLTVRRCRIGAELAWTWPSWGVEAFVEWPTNAPDGMQRHRAHLTRHEFEQTGCWRTPVRDQQTSFAVTVRGLDRSAAPLTATLRARRAEVRYTISRIWWHLGPPVYRVVVSTQWPPPPYCEIVIGWSRSRYLPDPDDLQELDSLPVPAGATSRTVSLPRRCGARWVRCFLREGDDVILLEPDIERLQVRPWPR